MIELRQQIGHKKNGTRVVYQMDKVYRIDPVLDTEEYLGWCGRTPDAAFHPHHDLTDAEKKEVIAAVNAHHADNGYPPLARFGKSPLKQVEIHRLIESLKPKRPQSSEDDE